MKNLKKFTEYIKENYHSKDDVDDELIPKCPKCNASPIGKFGPFFRFCPQCNHKWNVGLNRYIKK
jgi:hypothetical protein